MSTPFLGEIRMFAGNFAPLGWSMCDGQYLSPSQNDALFSLIGTMYGGDGSNTFQLPDCRGRIPIHMGHGNGLSNRILASKGGTETVTLTVQELPPHNHSWPVTSANASERLPSNNGYAQSLNADLYQTDVSQNLGIMNPTVIGFLGGSQSHNNMMPTLCINFIISLVGIYPTMH